MRRWIACVLITVGIAACVAPPEKERHEAEAAIDAARQVDAAAFAPNELHAAENALKRYDDAVAQRDYRQALSAALEARDLANQASKQAAVHKADVQRQAEQLVADADSLTKVMAARLAGATGPRPTGATAERLRTALRTATPVLQKARTQMQKQDYQAVVDELTPVVDALRREPAPSRASRPPR
jgi:molecular chaperone GrpE (heat shock protein)